MYIWKTFYQKCSKSCFLFHPNHFNLLVFSFKGVILKFSLQGTCPLKFLPGLTSPLRASVADADVTEAGSGPQCQEKLQHSFCGWTFKEKVWQWHRPEKVICDVHLHELWETGTFFSWCALEWAGNQRFISQMAASHSSGSTGVYQKIQRSVKNGIFSL